MFRKISSKQLIRHRKPATIPTPVTVNKNKSIKTNNKIKKNKMARTNQDDKKK